LGLPAPEPQQDERSLIEAVLVLIAAELRFLPRPEFLAAQV